MDDVRADRQEDSVRVQSGVVACCLVIFFVFLTLPFFLLDLSFDHTTGFSENEEVFHNHDLKKRDAKCKDLSGCNMLDSTVGCRASSHPQDINLPR